MDQCDTLDVTAKRKVPEMPIKITRIETLALMQELPANHFLQSRLVDELVELNKSAADRLGSPEVHNGALVVTRSKDTLTAEFVTPELGKGQYTDAQLDEMYEAGGIAPERQCKWTFYGHQCTKTSTNEFCDEHNGKTCSHRDSEGVSCGKKADHGCPTEWQFVCGAPCCAAHSSCGCGRQRTAGRW
jgi:hypothetical protein